MRGIFHLKSLQRAKAQTKERSFYTCESTTAEGAALPVLISFWTSSLSLPMTVKRLCWKTRREGELTPKPTRGYLTYPDQAPNPTESVWDREEISVVFVFALVIRCSGSSLECVVRPKFWKEGNVDWQQMRSWKPRLDENGHPNFSRREKESKGKVMSTKNTKESEIDCKT